MGLLLGAEQVDVEGEEELPCPCGSGPPAGDKGAGAEVGRPLSLLELWKDSPWGAALHGRGAPLGLGEGEGRGYIPLQGSPQTRPPSEKHGTFSGRASYSPARMAGRVRRLATCAASP